MKRLKHGSFTLVLLMCAAMAVPLRAQTPLGVEGTGVPAELDGVYQRGLEYLVKSQQTNGAWRDNYGQEPGVIGLAVLALMAGGEDPNFGRYSKTIGSALQQILERQDPTTGYIGTSMYNHGFATLALAEAYGAVNNPRLGPALQKAVDLILAAQERNDFGGWRYSPDSSDADTTVSGAQMVALFAARNAGIGVPEAAIDRALEFFLQCQTPDGGFGYTDANGPNAPRTAIGTLVLALAREQKSKAFEAGFAYTLAAPVNEQSYYHYYLYYASQALFQGSLARWNEWNTVNLKNLRTSQAEDGSWEGQYGATFTTASCLLSLALNYRFLPIYER
jgi:hypothetical protein